MTRAERPTPELDALVVAYQEATERLKATYESLSCEVARLHEELASKNRELARRERLAALGQLAAGLAHEIRNPLGAIALYASMLQKDLEGRDPELTLAKKIASGVRSLDQLVNEILEFAHEDHLERQTARLGDVLEPVLENIQAWIGAHDIRVNVSAESRETILYCDTARTQRVLMNIMLNAVQAVGERGEIGLAATTDAQGRVALTIWDTGPGIPDDRIERIFDPFYTTRASGTGLGLAIVHRIVEAHGGTIRVRNGPTGGLHFTMEFPGPTAEPVASRRLTMEQTESTGAPASRRRKSPGARPTRGRMAS